MDHELDKELGADLETLEVCDEAFDLVQLLVAAPANLELLEEQLAPSILKVEFLNF